MLNRIGEKKLLIALLVVALCERVFVALITNGYNHPHEVYRVLEPIREILYGTSVKVFEFKLNMLSYVPILIQAGYIKLVIVFGAISPILQVKMLHIFYAVLSMLQVVGMYLILKKHTNYKFALTSFLFTILWLPFVYFQVHFLEEIVTANLIYISFLIYELSDKKKINFLLHLFSGLMLGLIFFVRFQSAFIHILFFAFLVFNKNYKILIYNLLGFSFFLVFGSLVDLSYGVPFLQAPFNNFAFSALEGGATKNWGSQSFFYYFTEMFKFYSPIFFICIWAFLYWSFKRARFLSFLMLGFFVIHLAITHKELRFMFPILTLFPLVALIGFYQFYNSYKTCFAKKYIKVGCVVVLIFSFSYGIYRGLYRYSYTSYAENCETIYLIGNWYKNSTLKDIDEIYVMGEHTFMCGSFYLGDTFANNGKALKLNYSTIGEEPKDKIHFVLKQNGKNTNTDIEVYLQSFGNWDLSLVQPKL